MTAGWPQTAHTPVLLGREQGYKGGSQAQQSTAEFSSGHRVSYGGQVTGPNRLRAGRHIPSLSEKDRWGPPEGNLHRGGPAGKPPGATQPGTGSPAPQGIREALGALREWAGPGPTMPTARPRCAAPCQAAPNSQCWKSVKQTPTVEKGTNPADDSTHTATGPPSTDCSPIPA